MTLREVCFLAPVLLVFSTLTLAAEKIDTPPNYCEKISSVTLSRDVVSPDDATDQVNAIADKKGASHYMINYVSPSSRNGSSLRVSADLYRC